MIYIYLICHPSSGHKCRTSLISEQFHTESLFFCNTHIRFRNKIFSNVTGMNEPDGRTWCSLNTLFPKQALLYGGYSSEARALSDFWRIEVDKNRDGLYVGTWTEVDSGRDAKYRRLWHTGAVVEGQLFGKISCFLKTFFLIMKMTMLDCNLFYDA